MSRDAVRKVRHAVIPETETTTQIVQDIEKGAALAPAAPAAGAGAPLPCLSRNISNEDWSQDGYTELSDYHKTGLSDYHKKVAECIKLNAAWLIERYGIEHVGFLTLTFKSDVGLKAAQRRFNSMRTGFLTDHFGEFIKVTELTRRGWVHYHLMIVTRADIRTGFDFQAQKTAQTAVTIADRRRWTKIYAASASPYLRGLWKLLREKSDVYGFGRHELLPIRSSKEAVAWYLGGYVSKCVKGRRPQDKGARFYQCSQGWKAASVHFAWRTIRSWIWRQKVAKLAAVFGAADTADLARICGKHWCYHLKEQIFQMTGLDTYPTWQHAQADGWCAHGQKRTGGKFIKPTFPI